MEQDNIIHSRKGTHRMQQNTPGYLGPDSYQRAREHYKKTLKFWDKAKFGSLYPLVFGLIELPFLLLNSNMRPGRQLPANLVIPAITLDIALLLTGALMFGIAAWIIKHRQLDYAAYRLALYSMKDMGIPHPAKVLATNPRYFEAYEEVYYLYTSIDVHETDPNKRLEDFSAHAHRIASLVLRNERSLKLAPHLIALINADHMRSYESLAGELDHHTPAPRT